MNGTPRPAGHESHPRWGNESADDLRRLIQGIWAERLRLDEVKPDTDFFWSGGHSLIAVQIVSRLRTQLAGVRIPPMIVFEYPIFGDFIKAIERLVQKAAAEP